MTGFVYRSVVLFVCVQKIQFRLIDIRNADIICWFLEFRLERVAKSVVEVNVEGVEYDNSVPVNVIVIACVVLFAFAEKTL